MDARAEIESRAVRLLAHRDHGREELRRKLTRRGVEDSPLLDEVLDELEQRHYLDDARFVEGYIAYRKRKGFGPLHILRELRERGIAQSLIDDWLDPDGPEWRELLRQAVERKFGAGTAEGSREQGRRARFLESRGFPAQLIGDFLWRGG